jgi:hypothetical protein
MVGLDGRTTERCDFCPREEQRSSSALGVAFEHPDILRSGWAIRKGRALALTAERQRDLVEYLELL